MKAPHWHAQIEVNYIIKGQVRYDMPYGTPVFSAGDFCFFWGAQPHQMIDSSPDSQFAVVHLPLVSFFRIGLEDDTMLHLMKGQTLLTRATDSADPVNFLRWRDYIDSGDPRKMSHMIDELLLRIERVCFEGFEMVGAPPAANAGASEAGHRSNAHVLKALSYIERRFRDDIGVEKVAEATGLHPKYIMNLFHRQTGLTVKKYINLLRVSYAQALLSKQNVSVLDAAMESGFGSLSAFNKSFRAQTLMTPMDWRRSNITG